MPSSKLQTITDIQTLYDALGARDYEAVMSHFAEDIEWIAADNSPLGDRSPYHGIDEIRSGVFERIAAGFEKLVVVPDEIFAADGGRIIVLGYYHGRFRDAEKDFKAQVAHIWTVKDGRATKFQQYLDTLQIARDSGAV
jgi:ketosteroid isomerase-like protein